MSLDQVEHPLQCPFCGEPITILLDPSAGPTRYTEDCEVCCRPIDLHISFDIDGDPIVHAQQE